MEKEFSLLRIIKRHPPVQRHYAEMAHIVSVVVEGEHVHIMEEWRNGCKIFGRKSYDSRPNIK